MVSLADVVTEKGQEFDFQLAGQSIWKNGETRVELVSEGITTAKNVFDIMNIKVIRPKPKLIGKNRIEENTISNNMKQ